MRDALRRFARRNGLDLSENEVRELSRIESVKRAAIETAETTPQITRESLADLKAHSDARSLDNLPCPTKISAFEFIGFVLKGNKLSLADPTNPIPKNPCAEVVQIVSLVEQGKYDEAKALAVQFAEKLPDEFKAVPEDFVNSVKQLVKDEIPKLLNDIDNPARKAAAIDRLVSVGEPAIRQLEERYQNLKGVSDRWKGLIDGDVKRIQEAMRKSESEGGGVTQTWSVFVKEGEPISTKPLDFIFEFDNSIKDMFYINIEGISGEKFSQVFRRLELQGNLKRVFVPDTTDIDQFKEILKSNELEDVEVFKQSSIKSSKIKERYYHVSAKGDEIIKDGAVIPQLERGLEEGYRNMLANYLFGKPYTSLSKNQKAKVDLLFKGKLEQLKEIDSRVNALGITKNRQL